MPAIEQAIYEGMNMNVTLLFSVDAYERWPRRTSAASSAAWTRASRWSRSRSLRFFVSRVDTEVDKRLEAMGRTELRGTAASRTHATPTSASRRSSPASAGSASRPPAPPVQRPLWASTGMKNPALPGDEVRRRRSSAPHTVNTMPMATLTAAAEQSDITGPTVDEDPTAELEALPRPASTWRT